MITYLLLGACAFFAIALVFSVRLNLTQDARLELLGEQVEQSLDIIDGCYHRIAQVAEMPVASDDPHIQQLVNDVRYIKQAVLVIAHKLVLFDERQEDDTAEKAQV